MLIDCCTLESVRLARYGCDRDPHARAYARSKTHRPPADQSSWWRFGSWMNFQCNCLAFSLSNFWRQSGHWKLPPVRMPTFITVPSPDFAASEITIVSHVLCV